MNDSKIEVVYNLVSESAVFRQNELVVFEFECDDFFSLKIHHNLVETLKRIAVPFDSEALHEIWSHFRRSAPPRIRQTQPQPCESNRGTSKCGSPRSTTSSPLA